MIPVWLHILSIAALFLGIFCALLVAIDVTRHHQQMSIMNIVWPVTALFGGPAALWGYFKYGRLATHEMAKPAMEKNEPPPSKRLTPFPAMVGKGTCHCGSGCTLGDICAEWLAFAFPGIAVWLGWQSIFADKMFAVWILDYVLAFLFGIVFQYMTIVPMRGLKFGEGVIAAVKADTLSLTAWQIGMYGFMALAQFYFFRTLIGVKLEVNSAEFWFMMQIAMWCGFVTSYPVNWWLIRSGLKEKM
ncbi:MAG TPA: DUF4396 domain-containing protein [Pseudolabrys sp.]|jgi:hypothetical protein|nr:DUF4396 domain-containing protein [Pseudolabrys sp.]